MPLRNYLAAQGTVNRQRTAAPETRRFFHFQPEFHDVGARGEPLVRTIVNSSIASRFGPYALSLSNARITCHELSEVIVRGWNNESMANSRAVGREGNA